MVERDETQEFDRLAGQPEEPEAEVGDLVESVGNRVGGDTIMNLRNFTLTGLRTTRPQPVVRSLWPWVIAITSLLGASVFSFGWLLPTQIHLADLELELDNAQKEKALIQQEAQRLQTEMLNLETKTAQLEKAKQALLKEIETLQALLEEKQRAEEAMAAELKRAEDAAKKKRTAKPKRRYRRR